MNRGIDSIQAQASIHAANARRRHGSLIDKGTEKRGINRLKPWRWLQEGERKRKQREKDRKSLVAARQKMLDAEKQFLEQQKAKLEEETMFVLKLTIATVN